MADQEKDDRKAQKKAEKAAKKEERRQKRIAESRKKEAEKMQKKFDKEEAKREKKEQAEKNRTSECRDIYAQKESDLISMKNELWSDVPMSKESKKAYRQQLSNMSEGSAFCKTYSEMGTSKEKIRKNLNKYAKTDKDTFEEEKREKAEHRASTVARDQNRKDVTAIVKSLWGKTPMSSDSKREYKHIMTEVYNTTEEYTAEERSEIRERLRTFADADKEAEKDRKDQEKASREEADERRRAEETHRESIKDSRQERKIKRQDARAERVKGMVQSFSGGSSADGDEDEGYEEEMEFDTAPATRSSRKSQTVRSVSTEPAYEPDDEYEEPAPRRQQTKPHAPSKPRSPAKPRSPTRKESSSGYTLGGSVFDDDPEPPRRSAPRKKSTKKKSSPRECKCECPTPKTTSTKKKSPAKKSGSKKKGKSGGGMWEYGSGGLFD